MAINEMDAFVASLAASLQAEADGPYVAPVPLHLQPWTAEDYLVYTNLTPDKDDLERVNCPKGGQAGHTYCGRCVHNWPRLLDCAACRLLGERQQQP